MSELRRHAEDYLRLRRSLGFKLILHGPLLAQFVDYLDAAGATTLTTELAISFAQYPLSLIHIFPALVRAEVAGVDDAPHALAERA